MITLNKSLTSSQLQFYNAFQIFGNLTFSRYFVYAVLIITILGFFPRYVCILHWWVTISFLLATPMIEGGDQIASIYTFLIIPPLLFQKNKNHWLSSNQNINNFYINVFLFYSFILIKLQAFIIYFFSVINKFSVEQWQNGTAIYYWFTDPIFGLNDNLYNIFEIFLSNPYVIVGLTWGALIIELSLAIFIIMPSKLNKKNLNKIFFFIGLSFHLLISIFFGLWSFMFAMIGVLALTLQPFNNPINKPSINEV